MPEPGQLHLGRLAPSLEKLAIASAAFDIDPDLDRREDSSDEGSLDPLRAHRGALGFLASDRFQGRADDRL